MPVDADASPPLRRPLCAFCEAPYSDAMIAWLGPPNACACCGGTVRGHWPIKPAPQPNRAPQLACEACGRVLYTA